MLSLSHYYRRHLVDVLDDTVKVRRRKLDNPSFESTMLSTFDCEKD